MQQKSDLILISFRLVLPRQSLRPGQSGVAANHEEQSKGLASLNRWDSPASRSSDGPNSARPWNFMSGL